MCFLPTTVEYLGHRIIQGKLGVLEANIRALKDARYPNTQTELKSFIGMCNVFRRFVEDFARMYRLLTVLSSSTLPKVLQHLSPDEEAAVEAL